jgi:alpha,alpha-trehalase
MGPDEYHDRYPGAAEPGIDNNSYTNVMTVWCLQRAIDMLDSLSAKERVELEARVSFDAAELERWADITRKMKVVFHDDGVISQFEGYAQLAEFDWDAYRATYGDIQRLDRILGAEGDSPNRYKLSKQADALMIFFLLSPEEVGEVFERLGYPWSPQTADRTVDYYLARTSHGSTLSRVVHAWLLAARDPEQSWALFTEALRSDVDDIQGGTTSEGVHLGVMAGTADLVQRGYAGIELRGDAIWVNPALPEQISRVATSVRYQGHCMALEVSRSRVIVRSEHDNTGTCRVGVGDRVHDVAPGDSVELAWTT